MYPQFTSNPLCQVTNNSYECITLDVAEDNLIITNEEPLFVAILLTKDASNLKVKRSCVDFNPDGALSIELCTNTSIQFNWDELFPQMSTIVDG